MQIITIYDFLLLPLYLGIFYFFAKRRAKNFSEEAMKNIFLIAFTLRMLGSVAYSLLVQYYYGYGDSFTYYVGSDFIHEHLIQNFSNIKYFFVSASEFQQWYNTEFGESYYSGWTGIASSNAIMKISALLSFVSFNKFMIISLFFGLFSFAGQWKLFQVFNDYNKGKNLQLLAYAVLYSPSIWFWGSGLMKDSICLGATGFIISIFYNSFAKKQISIAGWLMLPVLIYMTAEIKSYIPLILLISLIITLFLKYVFLLKNTLARIGMITLFILTVVFLTAFLNISNQVNDLVQESYSQIQSYQKNYESVQSSDESSMAGFELKNLDASLSSLLLKSPGVVFTCLFRPFLWESKKIIIFLTALESTLLLLFTLFLLIKTRFIGFFRIVFSNQLILFSFIVSILFALIIGFTTFNFGTMTRYKIILLPFYYFMLVSIYNKINDSRKSD